MSEMEQTRENMTKAAGQLRDAQEIIYQLATTKQELEHKLAARDIAIKQASSGQVPLADLPDKVAELESKTDDDLVTEEKLASLGVSAHRVIPSGSQTDVVGVGAMDFLGN